MHFKQVLAFSVIIFTWNIFSTNVSFLLSKSFRIRKSNGGGKEAIYSSFDQDKESDISGGNGRVELEYFQIHFTFLATKPKGDCGKTNHTYAPSGFPHGTLYLLAVFIQMYLTLCMNACFHHQGGSPVNSQWAGQNNIIKERQSKQCIQMKKVFLNVH